MEFKIRIQEIIELIKANELMKTIEYAKKQLTKFDEEPELMATV